MRSIVQSIFIRVLRAVSQTWRIRLVEEEMQEILSMPAIVLFWHDEMLPVWHIFAPKKTITHATALTSLSNDGSVLAELLRLLGYTVVRGSSSRGGSEALQEIVRATEQGMVLLTPDGPRGPRHVCKIGGIVAAHRTGVPLRLVRIRAEGWRLLRSWDHFLIPYPFARIEIVTSEAIIIPADASREEITRYCEKIQRQLEVLGEA